VLFAFFGLLVTAYAAICADLARTSGATHEMGWWDLTV
jgi:hypothetical protein